MYKMSHNLLDMNLENHLFRHTETRSMLFFQIWGTEDQKRRLQVFIFSSSNKGMESTA